MGLRKTMRAAMAAGAVLGWGALAPAMAQQGADTAAGGPELPPVLPYRPSVSSPAQLPAPGQLELELGGLASRDGGARRASLPYTLKLAFSPEWGVLLGGEAWVAQRDDGAPRLRGAGDTLFVVKRAWAMGEGSALGLELGAKMPTARDGIGSGRPDYSVNGILSRDFGSVHMDANLNLARLGGAEPGLGRVQTGASASFSVPLDERWGATAELAGTHRSGAPGTAQLLLAAAYSPHPRLTIDFGLARGITRAAPDWQFFSGIVLPLVNFW
ncbi:transporter [Pseudoduganella aquatica]|uniref:transporter n=1 Tax=Pseudoduganella aquatica TaxID=2660641 RepID=UPI001E321934|nr:transporter [Pseudoduganella aquatica]